MWCTIGTVNTMEFENLNFGMLLMGLNVFWLGLSEMEPKMLDLYTKMHKNALGLKGIEWSYKNHVCPLL